MNGITKQMPTKREQNEKKKEKKMVLGKQKSLNE